VEASSGMRLGPGVGIGIMWVVGVGGRIGEKPRRGGPRVGVEGRPV
jgi:hypothetical protein